MWRTGDDLFSSNYDMWLNRLDLATADSQAALTGPGAFPNPDFLEVGYSPRSPKGHTQTALEQRSMFTMWAALPGPLILSADLRPGATCGGIDAEALETLTNKEVIAVNQDLRALPMRPVRKEDHVEVWKKPLVKGMAVILFNRNSTATTSIGVSWPELGFAADAAVEVRDLWGKKDLGVKKGNFSSDVQSHEAAIFVFTPGSD